MHTPQLSLEDSSGLPNILNNLSNGLRIRYTRTGDLNDLKRSVAYSQQAVRSTPERSPELASRLNSLASNLSVRYGCIGDLEDLDSAIDNWQRTIELTPEDSPNLPPRLNNLGSGLQSRYRRTGNLSDLETAIGHWERALKPTSESSPNRILIQSNLASGWQSRYARTGSLTDLEMAIAYWEAIVPLISADSPDLPSVLNNLAGGLRVHFKRSGNLGDLDSAIDKWERAKSVVPENSPDLPVILSNLASGLNARHAHTGSLEDLMTSIGYWQQAVDLSSDNSPMMAGFMNNLANGLRTLYSLTSNISDLEAAVRYWEGAIELLSPDSPFIPMILNNLAGGLRSLCIHKGDELYLQSVIDLWRRATCCGLEMALEDGLRSARNWGNWALQRREWQEAAEAYDYGRQAIDGLFTTQTSREAKESWLREAQGLSANAAYALAKLNRLTESVETMEAGRARLLAEALEQNRRDLEQLELLGHKAALNRYRTAAQRVTALQKQAGQPATQSVRDSSQSPNQPVTQFDYSAWRQQLEQAQVELKEAIDAIRQVPGYEDLFLPLSFKKIQQAATPDAPLVYLVTTSAGSVALVVRASQTLRVSADKDASMNDDSTAGEDQTRRVSAVWLDLTEAELNAMLFDVDGEGRYLRGAFFDDTDALARSLENALPLLGERLLDRLAAHLEESDVQRISLIPAGRLALLPLHAAPTANGQTFQERFTLAYAPSASALLHATAQRPIAAQPLLAVGNPISGELVDIALLFTQLLVDEASGRVAGATTLARGDATVAAVEQALARGPGHLLFGCHGRYEVNEPLQSGLELADGRLTLDQLLNDVQLPATELAVLCACQSGLSDFSNLSDEVVGLPAGFLLAGVRAVVGTLWPVAALPSVLLLRRFYDQLLSGAAPAVALRDASLWLRRLERREFEQQMTDLWRQADPPTAFYLELVAGAFTGQRPFAGPAYWAGFTFNGALASQGETDV